MTTLPKDIQEQMNEVAYKYAKVFLARAVNALKAKSSTGALHDSVVAEVRKATDTEPPVIELRFLEYGEYIGKKKLLWTKQPPVDELKDWAIRRGIDNNRIPGYKPGTISNLSQEKKATRVAWAVAIFKRRENSLKRIPWKRDTFKGILKQMNDETTREFAVILEQLFAESIEGIRA